MIKFYAKIRLISRQRLINKTASFKVVLIVFSFSYIACNNYSPFKNNADGSENIRPTLDSDSTDDTQPDNHDDDGPDQNTNPGPVALPSPTDDEIAANGTERPSKDDQMELVKEYTQQEGFYEFERKKYKDWSNLELTSITTLRVALTESKDVEKFQCNIIRGQDLDLSISRTDDISQILDFHKVNSVEVPMKMCEPLLVAGVQDSSCNEEVFLNEHLEDSRSLKDISDNFLFKYRARTHKVYSTEDCLCLEEWAGQRELVFSGVEFIHKLSLKFFSDKCPR